METIAEVKTYLDRILSLLESIADHFVYQKHVTLSEMFLFALAFVRAVWFTFFGVSIGAVGRPLTHEVWLPLFWILSISHLAAFFLRNTNYRVAVMCAYGMMWLFIAGLVSFEAFTSPAVPTFAIFGLSSVFVAFRLTQEEETV